MGGDTIDEILQRRASSSDEIIGVCFLKEPQLLKGDDRVAFGELHVELNPSPSQYKYHSSRPGWAQTLPISSFMLITSDFLPCDQPRRATKLANVSGATSNSSRK